MKPKKFTIKLFLRFCVGDKFYLCDNKILCEYDYEERLVFASMANHPILKRHATSNCSSQSPGLQNSAAHTNGHHHNLLASMNQRGQTNDLNNNSSVGGINNLAGFGGQSHLKQHVVTN